MANVTEIKLFGPTRKRLLPMILAAILLVLVQAAIGIVVNLYVTIPARHPGAHPSNYLSGSFHSVAWAIAHGDTALAIHAALGLILVVIAVGIAIDALRLRSRAIAVWSSIAASLVIGAAFNGASFVDFNHNASSLIMALLAFAAAGCYSVAMFLLARAADDGE